MSRRLLNISGAIALVALVFVFSQATSVPVAEAAPGQPATMSLDIYMCDGAGVLNQSPFCDNSANTVSGDDDGLIEDGENPEVVTNLWIGLDWTTDSDEAFFDLANTYWTTGAEGADVTGDGFNDPVVGIAANAPATLGAAVGEITFDISTNLLASLLFYNNVDDATASAEAGVTGQPPTCGAVGTVSIADDFELWNANTALSPTVDYRDSDENGCAESQEDVDTGECDLNNYPAGVPKTPSALVDTIVGVGLPISSYMSRAYGIARLDIMGVASNDVDVNFLVFNVLDDVGFERYVSITVVQYPTAPSGEPFAGDELGQTVATCPPYYSSPVRIFGVSQDPDYNEDDDNTDATEVGKGGEEVRRAIGASGTFDYVLDKSVTEDYDGDGIAGAHDRCDTDPATGSPGDDTDGDWMTGTCDVLGEGSGCPGTGNSMTIPWDTCQDVDGDNRINQNDNCPNDYDPTIVDSDGDGVGDVCDADPDIVGDGTGYDAGLNDSDNKCVDEYTIGAQEVAAEAGALPGVPGAGKYCMGPAAETGATQVPYINPQMAAIGNDPYEDSDDDGMPDYEVVAGVGTLFDADSNSDEDGHTDACEGFSGSDALDTSDVPGGAAVMCDCDGGGQSDEDEVANGTDPFTADGEGTNTDDDGDGCVSSEEQVCSAAPKPGATGAFDPAKWYDFYDVPVSANRDWLPVDNDGDQHEDGTRGNPGDNECTDLSDNDGDTKTDGADPDCSDIDNPGVDEDPIDTVDNDGDTLVDEDSSDEDDCYVSAICVASGPRSGAVTMGDVLATLTYVGTSTGTGTNPNGVNYNILKDGDWFDTANQIIGSDGTTDADDAVGRRYDRSPSDKPDPPADAGAPNGAVSMGDVLAILAQVGLSCAGAP